MELLKNITEKLTIDKTIYSTEQPFQKIILPFINNKFILEQWKLWKDEHALLIRDKNEIVGYFQYSGPDRIEPRFGFCGLDNAYGFGYLSEMQSFFANQINSNPKPGNPSLFVRKDYSKKYSGIGKTIITCAIESMVEELRKTHHNVSKEVMEEYRKTSKNEIPLLIIRRVHTDIFMKHYQARSTKYKMEDNDHMIYLEVKPPKLEILEK